MLKAVHTPSEPSHQLRWCLVEIENESGVEYLDVDSKNLLGNINNIYVSRKVQFIHNQTLGVGTIRMASDNFDVINAEKERLTKERIDLYQAENANKLDLWCLVRDAIDCAKVRLTIVSSKKLTSANNPIKIAKQFLMAKGKTHVPVLMLDIIESEQQLFQEIAFLNDSFMQNLLNKEKDHEVEMNGLDKSYFLVQYYEDNNNIVYTIIKYSDTTWKEENQYPNVVAYIVEGGTVHQCIIIRKSYDLAELMQILSRIKDTCDKLDYKLLHSQLQKREVPPEGNEAS